MNDLSVIESIFLAALEKGSPAERGAYLDQACGDDPELRRHVERLLEAHPRAGGFLDAPAPLSAHTLEEASHSDAFGAMIGPYKLLEQIGEGGMGTVWMAEQQEPVRRKVALKLIKAGMDSRQVIARFEAERQALALMDHPNIAKVLDAGEVASGQWPVVSEENAALATSHWPLPTSSRPYFVMDLVKGVPITKYCDEHRLTPRQRLELFVPICHAIQHAHQKGIIHRDLKPSNVLIALYDDKPVPKVIDFGVAKATGTPLTEETLHTGFGAVVGTVEYMSPEQATLNQLDVDTRSDIYSLGVLLYELLAGSPPFTRKELEKAGMLEMLRVIREQEPSKPSTKLSTAEALPTLAANRGTEPAKLTKLVRGELDWIVMKALEKDRNRRYETANGFAADVQRYLADEPVLACPPSAWYRFRKFARRNKRALATAAVAVLALLVAVGSIGWVARDRAARLAAVEVEVDLALKEAERLQDEGKYPQALSAAKRAEALVTGGSQELRQRVCRLRADLDMVARLERIRLQQGDTKVSDFAYEDADPEYARAFRAYGLDLANLDPAAAAERIRASAIRDQLLIALDDWAWVKSRTDPAGREGLLAIARQADPDEWRNLFRDAAVERDPNGLEKLAARPEVASLPPATTVLLARKLDAAGMPHKAVEVLSAAQLSHPGDLWLNFELSRLLLWRISPRRPGEARGYARAALALRPDSAGLYVRVGDTLRTKEVLDEAIAAYRKAIELQPDYAVAYKALGAALARKGAWHEAITAYAEGIRLAPKMSNTHVYLHVAYQQTQQWDKAIATLQEATRLRPDDARAQAFLAWCLANHPTPASRDIDQALERAKIAVKLAPKNGNAWEAMAAACYRAGDWPGAIAAADRARQVFGAQSSSYQFTWLAMAHWQQGNKEEALLWYDRSAKWLEKNLQKIRKDPWLNEYDLRRLHNEAAELLGIQDLPRPKDD